jgi:hypothetical protein
MRAQGDAPGVEDEIRRSSRAQGDAPGTAYVAPTGLNGATRRSAESAQ